MYFAATFNPTGPWIAQQLKFAFRDRKTPKYLVHDNEPAFSSSAVKKVLKTHGVKPKKTAKRSPWQNGVAERLIRTLRTEVFDRILCFGSRQAEEVMKEYIPYYNQYRCHLTLGGDSPEGRPVMLKPSPDAKIKAVPVLNGLLHYHVWDTTDAA